MAYILIIDDEEIVRTMLCQTLKHYGYEVASAANGKKGLEMYHTKPADLVITDIFMPQKEGISTIIELKKEFPNAKIIAMSGGGAHGYYEALDYARVLGAECVLAKPFSQEELMEAIKKLLPGNPPKAAE